MDKRKPKIMKKTKIKGKFLKEKYPLIEDKKEKEIKFVRRRGKHHK